MKLQKIVTFSLVLLALHAAILPATAQAGPLLDWLRGCTRRSASPCGCQPAVSYGQPVASCGLQPNQCQVTCNQTCSRVVVNYVPYTAYRTSWEQVPVTQYKPVTSSDPCTGCTVTCMKPCTSYAWQMKQVPYTTYRPCYRTENYTVPVTYVTQGTPDCGCSVPTSSAVQYPANTGCSSCAVPTAVSSYYSSPAVTAPSNNLLPGSTYYSTQPATTTMPNNGAPTPADAVPEIQGVNPQSMQRPILERLQGTPTGSTLQQRVPPSDYLQTASPQDRDQNANEANVARQAWQYSPVRQASYTSTTIESSAPTEIRGQWMTKPNAKPNANSAWKTVTW